MKYKLETSFHELKYYLLVLLPLRWMYTSKQTNGAFFYLLSFVCFLHFIFLHIYRRVSSGFYIYIELRISTLRYMQLKPYVLQYTAVTDMMEILL